jgi:hypothetical protein
MGNRNFQGKADETAGRLSLGRSCPFKITRKKEGKEMKDQKEIEKLLSDCKDDLFAIESLVNVIGKSAAEIANGRFPDSKEEGRKLLEAFADVDTIFTRYLSPTIQAAQVKIGKVADLIYPGNNGQKEKET